MYFLALSHAPPVFDADIAICWREEEEKGGGGGGGEKEEEGRKGKQKKKKRKKEMDPQKFKET